MPLLAFWVCLVTLMLTWGTWPAWLLLAVLPALGLLALRAADVGPLLLSVLLAFPCAALIDHTLADRTTLNIAGLAVIAVVLLTAADTITTAESAVIPEEPPAPTPLLRHDDPFDEED